jgi:tRNA-2-methylthio-N6-dimethylallyladenosine synthase
MSYPPPLKRVYIETYGCQMNVADSEVVGGILSKKGYAFTDQMANADVVLVNTCAVRDNAEQRVYGRLGLIQYHKRLNPTLVVGVLGCMAERLRKQLVDDEGLVDMVVGPDEYRNLPALVERAFQGEKGIAVRLSRVENYDDVEALHTAGVSAWVSVMRGCDKFCTFCVVPFTRGRERSRSMASVTGEVRRLVDSGFKEVTLLGQNVNSYHDGANDFAALMRNVAAVDSTLRVRFTTSHPQDMSDRLIETIAKTKNLCKYIHLPVQSGSDRILHLMNRTYTVDHYVGLVERIRRAIPGVGLSTDVISGFPTETEDDHLATVALMKQVRFDGAYTFKYSPRERTKAWDMGDDITEEEKGRRVGDIAALQHQISMELNSMMAGRTERILVEGPSRKSVAEYCGRTDTNKTVVYPHTDERPGDMIDVVIDNANSATLFARRNGIPHPRTEVPA